MSNRFLLSIAAMLGIQKKHGYNRVVSSNQAGPTKPNGHRPMFKQNRRAQIKANKCKR